MGVHMQFFGGIGGVSHTRPFEEYAGDRFAQDLNHALGDRMRADNEFCQKVWGALANVSWRHANGDRAEYTFRAAGDLIASILGRGTYVDWYGSARPGSVSGEVSAALAPAGWSSAPYEAEI